MKAIRVHQFGDPEVMKQEEIPDLQPGPGQVVVGIKAIGINPVDTYTRAGQGSLRLVLPYTPGNDAAGIVERAGQDVVSCKVGDRVYISGSISGTYAEQSLCEQAQVHPLPAAVSFEQGAAVGVPYGTAYHALFHRAHARPGETVLVHGSSGGTGTAAVQIARAAGMIVIGSAGTEKGMRLSAEQGAHYVLDHHAPDAGERLMALTQGRGVDIILEMLANVNLGNDLKVLAPRGRVVVIGSRGNVEINPRDAMMRNASILGMLLFNATEGERAEIHAYLVIGLENGTLRPVVGQKIPLAEAPRGHRAIMEPGAYGKIVLIP
jgi:NADPH:quinone reductase